MATNFTNKYMQVFQNYNEFGEHSADYVRGEDHIAFLIEENEVIYWLYLEQVWRPLNVRTTTTGQLEDGRTKVAVRLEYIEGGQKYTSVPNIPDPERITSMSRFLEDYPDIEEVNVSGTINLTDLSYAFAGSKIKDFSMLDTSNVTNFKYIFKDINDETRDLFLKINQSINNIIAGDIVLNNLTIESTNEKVISTVKLGESNIKNSLIIKGNINFELIYDTLTSSKFYRFNNIKSDANINLLSNEQDSYVDYNNIICKELTLGWNTINVLNSEYTFETHCDKIIIENGDNNGYTARDWRKIECYDVKEFILKTRYDNTFSGGIKFNNNDDIKITINDTNRIGNFWFTTPIIDDAFYAKYAQYNTPISIFQYKTTFEEVADVNISSEVDSSLIYIDWSNIDFDTSNMNVEINNIINIINLALSKTFNNIIIDNRGLTEELEKDDLPMLITDGKAVDNNGYISGNYKSNGNELYYNSLFKDLNYYDFNGGYRFPVDCFDANKNYNIKLYPTKSYNNYFICFEYIGSNRNPNITYFNIDNLIIDNNLIFDICYGNNIYNYIANYVENTIANIYVYFNNFYLYVYYEYLKNSNINNQFNIKVSNNTSKSIYLTNNTGGIYEFDETPSDLDTVYINMENKNNLLFFVVYPSSSSNNNYSIRGIYFKIKNILGNINIGIPMYINATNINVNTNYNNNCHIDIQLSNLESNSGDIRWYSTVLDDETTINLITKLVDNTDSSSKTIYMYRSQSNIIGEENIAAAVAKNYEFAIIEN